MFARKYPLSAEEKQALVNVRRRLMHAFSSRLHDPADFDANLNYLRIYEGFVRAYDKLARQHLHTISQGRRAHHGSCFSFAAIFGNGIDDPLKYFHQEASAIIFTQPILQLKQKHLVGDVRIAQLDFNLKMTKKRSVQKGREVFTPIELLEYKIVFSDGDELTLTTLDDEAQLAQAREIYETKMAALSCYQKLKK